eukprot:10355742-Heterocapsa_arctica.AAC.1
MGSGSPEEWQRGQGHRREDAAGIFVQLPQVEAVHGTEGQDHRHWVDDLILGAKEWKHIGNRIPTVTARDRVDQGAGGQLRVPQFREGPSAELLAGKILLRELPHLPTEGHKEGGVE